MNGHLDQWLEAFLDGELTGFQQRQAEAHLSGCRRCQELVEQRHALSVMLQLVPQAQDLKPAARFAAEVGLKLQRHPQVRLTPLQELSQWVKSEPLIQMSWLAVPVMLLMASAFIQSAAVISEVLSAVPGYHQVLLEQLSLAQASFGMPVGEPWQAILSNSGLFNILGWNWLAGQIALIAIGLLYLAWLAAWLVRERNSQLHPLYQETTLNGSE